MHCMTTAEPRPFENARLVYPERRICFLIAGSVRHRTTLWEVARLWRSLPLSMDQDHWPAGQISGAGIDPIESFVLAWHVLRLGVAATWARAKLHLGNRWRDNLSARRLRTQR